MAFLPALLVACMGLVGCFRAHEPVPLAPAPVDSGAPDVVRAPDTYVEPPPPMDSGVDAPPPEDAACETVVIPGEVSDIPVDILFVVDNSGSMTDEQAALAQEFPRMAQVLGTGDLDGDGVEDFPPIRSLHVGIVTTDMGAGNHLRRICPNEDGVLRNRSGSLTRGCPRELPRFLTFEPGGDEPIDEFARNFRCVAQVGTEGCGVEQPLEAALKALTPSTSDIPFETGSGHGDGLNAGFLRDNSLLAILVVSDEDDCGLSDPELWDPDSATYFGDYRCVDYEATAVHSIDRYVDGFRRLRSDPNRLVVAAITGVAPDMVEDAEAVDYDAILEDPRMERVPDTSFLGQGGLVPVCENPSRGSAEPAPRIVQTVRAFGDNGSVQSICQDDFRGALGVIIARLGRAIERIECLSP